MRAAAFLAAVLWAGPAAAFPGGAPWEAAAGEGCTSCHFDSPAVADSPALVIEGLPDRVEPGAIYRLTVRLESGGMEKAGFMLTARQGEGEAGRFTAVDRRAETNGAKARSTRAGGMPTAPGRAEWTLEWQAPERLDGAVLFDLWANAANGDDSPLGDETHRRERRQAVRQ